jgi:hypothetical protein
MSGNSEWKNTSQSCEAAGKIINWLGKSTGNGHLGRDLAFLAVPVALAVIVLFPLSVRCQSQVFCGVYQADEF